MSAAASGQFSNTTQAILLDSRLLRREGPYARRVRDSLWVVAATIALVTGLLSLASLPRGDWREIVTRLTFALTALVLGTLAIYWRRRPPKVERAHLLMGLVCVGGTASVCLQFITMQAPIYTVNLAVVLVASGAIMTRRVWLFANTLLLIGAWCVVGLRHPDAAAWEPYRWVLPRVALLAFGLQEALRRGAQRAWKMRIEIERRRRESEATAEKLRDAQRLESIETIAGGLAHDFNNLLLAITGFTRLAQRRIPEDSPARDPLAEVLKAGDRATSLTSQLLAFSGGARVDRSLVSLHDEVRDLQGLLASALPKGVGLVIEAEASLPAVEIDVGQLQQVLMNLVVNAGEATQAAGSVQPVVIRIAQDELSSREASALLPPQERTGGRFVWVEVQDQGSGMDDETAARMFDPFFSSKESGRGLGLSAVLGIVRAHDAALLVESREGSGSIFRIYFKPSSQLPVEERLENVVPALPEGLLVLIVDDEPQVRKVASQLAETLGARTIEAEDGATALRIVNARSDLDAVLLDMTMPGLSGEETLREIHAIRPDLPVVLSSGYEQNAAVAASINQPHVAFMSKPYTPEVLAEKLHQVLHSGVAARV